jgi:hypothetical protein
MADHILAVSIEADGDDVHALLHWGEMWNHLTPVRKAQIISAIGDSMSDTCDDVSAESKALLIVGIVERTGLTPAEALHRIERLEQVLEDISDSDGWEDDA